MSAKGKIALIIAISVMSLAIFGLAIGFVLAAETTSMINTMQISYDAEDVSCTIDTWAINYPDTGTTGDQIGDWSENNPNTITVDPESSATEYGTIEYDEITLTAAGRAAYYFTITNTDTSGITKELKVDISITETDNTNMVVNVGESESNLTELTTTSSITYSAGTASNALTFVIVFIVDDPILDASYDGTINLKIYYEIEEA